MNAPVSEAKPFGSDSPGDLAAVFNVVYSELRVMAENMLRSSPPGQTLQPTLLVHEAFLRLMRCERNHWISRPYFFAAAAEAMRRILVDHARRMKTLRRGGSWVRISLDTVQLAGDADCELLLLVDDAIERLTAVHPKQAEVVKLMFFAGMTAREAGKVLGVADRTVMRYWAFARAWLYEELREVAESGDLPSSSPDPGASNGQNGTG